MLITINMNYSIISREQREIDFIIESEDRFVRDRSKIGSAISKADFKHIKWFKDNIAKNKPLLVSHHTGEQAGSMGDNLRAVPLDVCGD